MKANDLFILVGHEESQVLTNELRLLGVNAFSCDIKTYSGGRPDIHYQMDIFKAIALRKWDAAFFFPECTYLCSSGLHRNKNNPERSLKTLQALDHVRALMACGIRHYSIENSIGCISTQIRKPDQIIQPYQFGEDASKGTCLWLNGLPKLAPTLRIKGRFVNGVERWANQTDSGQNRLTPSPNRATLRSKTYKGIAEAMAKQWVDYLVTN